MTATYRGAAMRVRSSSSSSSKSASSSRNTNGSRVGDLAAIARVLVTIQPTDDAVARKRKLVAEFCRLVGEQVGRPAAVGEGLPPRMRQTLERLLAGDGEKQIAARLGVSRHTVHVYVKGLYRHYDVCSRGELLARFVRGAGAAGQESPTSRLVAKPT